MFNKLKFLIKFIIFVGVIIICGMFFNFITNKATSVFQDDEDPEDSVIVNKADIEISDNSIENTDVEVFAEDTEYLGMPINIEISNIGINLPIQLGEYDYDNQTWDIEKYKAYFASLSDYPNDKNSNTVIYAHNQKSEFYNLRNLSNDDEIIIVTKAGYRLIYKMDSTEFVDPNWGALFQQKYSTAHLTLITCSGTNNEYRRLVNATLVDVSRY